MAKEIFNNGMKVRREVLGEKHVDRAESKKDEFTE
ncbi:MAG: 4-carboxymuconolactone decarboxylase, partial [SAR202 cluster bacterium]|nr:4-carboxymuconolactone decarboxylase [SAR202 cluster bacterium]